MIDMRKTVIPKSDQLNADDLIGQTKTIKVTKVSLLTEADQPIAVFYEGDGSGEGKPGKPYKPCKSMRRVMVNCWGPDGNAYIGRSMTIFRDDKVAFGGAAVGGIRIANMSHIDGPVTMALTATRASRKPFTVQPLAVQQSPTPADLRTQGEAAAARGKAEFGKFWNALSREHRDLAGGKAQRDIWLTIATKTDEAPPPDDDLADILFDEQPPSPPAITPNDGGQGQAAAGNAFPVENGVGAPASVGEPAPDPQVTRTTEGAPPSPSVAAAPQGPQAGGEPSPQASPPAISPTAADDARRARVAEIKLDGPARAESGTAALSNYLEQLRQAGEADYVTSAIKSAWREVALTVDAVKAKVARR